MCHEKTCKKMNHDLDVGTTFTELISTQIDGVMLVCCCYKPFLSKPTTFSGVWKDVSYLNITHKPVKTQYSSYMSWVLPKTGFTHQISEHERRFHNVLSEKRNLVLEVFDICHQAHSIF